MAPEPDAAFEWNKLVGQAVLADHAAQRFVTLNNGVQWERVNAINAALPGKQAAEAMNLDCS